MTRWPLLLTVLALLGCSTATAQSGASQPTQPASQQPVAGDPCQVNGQTYCVLNPNVVQGTIGQTICKPDWTKTVRPPVAYTDQVKRDQMRQLGLPGSPSDYELDHRLAIELGGSPAGTPAEIKNLSPEAHPGSFAKDKDENAFKHRVCSGEPLRQAQTEFVTKWLAPWPAFKA